MPTISSVEPLLNEQRFISSFINNINGDIGELEAEIPWWDPGHHRGEVNAQPAGYGGTANRQNDNTHLSSYPGRGILLSGRAEGKNSTKKRAMNNGVCIT